MAKLIMTVAEMQDREKWLELRKTGICGSMGRHPLMGLTPRDL